MAQEIPKDILDDIDRAVTLHDRASSDYKQCLEFNKLLMSILGRLEDAGCYRAADRVMNLVMNCAPKEGSSCEKSSQVGEQIRRLSAVLKE